MNTETIKPNDVINSMQFFNADNMLIMAQYPDKYFDLCIVDPPYGIGEDGSKNSCRSKIAISKEYKPFSGNDKNPPNTEYFKELIRISKNQIIWGANHFISKIPFDSSCWIVWDKQNGANDFADCELAWTSFKTAVRKFEFMWHGMLQGNMREKEQRIHPTQKPVDLYAWILSKYAQPNQKILDTHLGSNSIGIAIEKANRLDKMNLEFVGIELDVDYYQAGIKRLKQYCRQGVLQF